MWVTQLSAIQLWRNVVWWESEKTEKLGCNCSFWPRLNGASVTLYLSIDKTVLLEELQCCCDVSVGQQQ